MQMTKLKLADYKGKVGVCTRCSEWTEITEPCCGHAVAYEGDTICPWDFEEEDNGGDAA